MVKAERVIRYSRLKPEAELKNEATKPPVAWPQEGRIVFDHVSFAYGEESPLVLKNIFCDIQPKEKVCTLTPTCRSIGHEMNNIYIFFKMFS